MPSPRSFFFWKHRLSEIMVFKRPPGAVAVRYRRTGVEPAGLDIFFPVWAVTRLRWQLRKQKTWTVEVTTEGGSSFLLNRPVFAETVCDRAAAWALAQEIAERVERGELDEAVAAAKR